jgi:hypothetical protein
VVGFAVADDKAAGDPTAPVLQLFTWMGNVGALGIIALMAVTSVAVIVFFVRRGSGRAQAGRLVCSGLATAGLAVIFGYALTDFDVLLGADPDSPMGWILPGVLAVAAVLGLVAGLVMRRRRPWAHARIGLGNEAFQLEKLQEAEEPAGR